MFAIKYCKPELFLFIKSSPRIHKEKREKSVKFKEYSGNYEKPITCVLHSYPNIDSRARMTRAYACGVRIRPSKTGRLTWKQETCDFSCK